MYVYRARKPGARFRIPILSWHFAYVGETTSFYHRDQQHRYGLGAYNTPAQPWADRDPYVWLRIPLPPWKWLLRSVETLAIVATWPAYNVRKNLWNPRRIPKHVARAQRYQRDHGRPAWNVRTGHVVFVLALSLLVALYLAKG